jgi:hypothetical protein
MANDAGVNPVFRQEEGKTGTTVRILSNNTCSESIDLGVTAKNSTTNTVSQLLASITYSKFIYASGYHLSPSMALVHGASQHAKNLSVPFGFKFTSEIFDLCNESAKVAIQASDYIWLTEDEARKFLTSKNTDWDEQPTLEDVVIKLARW